MTLPRNNSCKTNNTVERVSYSSRSVVLENDAIFYIMMQMHIKMNVLFTLEYSGHCLYCAQSRYYNSPKMTPPIVSQGKDRVNVDIAHRE